ncbi:protein ALTERED PHOSPHATE STARVATION RESPONSE 1-like [Tasmannia lanceolata]|uniref:protein ALTERED PHOSPHATE STARVATION RESPONSE 1-like n=1 Tax=Tasmannia lanceolata TaxID=3420 RepID=UPI0040647C09
MGCSGSKLDDLQAVALCRDRSHHLESAIRFRYSLADAHVAYIHSLSRVGSSLHHFFDIDTPLLPLPPKKKGDPDPNPLPIPIPIPIPDLSPHDHDLQSHSNSDSHLHFHSDSDSDEYSFHDHETLASSPPRFAMNYMRNPAPPSQTVQLEASYGYSYPQSNPNPNSYSYPYSYPEAYSSASPSNPNPNSYPYSYPTGYSYPSYSSPPAAPPAAESSSKPPPPPPSPPRVSTWDFLNPFESVYDKYYQNSNTPSRDSKEVREEEGIPDLEDEDYQNEVVKEVHGEEKFGGYSEMVDDNEGEGRVSPETMYHVRSSGEGVKSGLDEYEVHLVDKIVVENEEGLEDQGNVGEFKARRSRGFSFPEVVREIKVQFDLACESGKELSKMLEAGKLPYHRKNAVHKASSKMLNVITPSLPLVSSEPSTSKSAESLPSTGRDGSLFLDVDKDMGMKAGNLSSTLEKLYIWEKKLYEKVRAEEKLRINLEKKCRRLKHLDERGAEAHKVDCTRTLIRDLSTKIRIEIQIIDSISNKINKSRDEELWPQITELIQGLIRMWEVMLECHRSQCQAITEARNLDTIASNRKLDDAHMEATLELEMELLNWILSFYSWVSAQKGYVKALNSWLLKCLHCEPEETDDGTAPFSPGRMGAPPVFVICYQWSQAMDNISENEVFEAMQMFATSVLQLWERHNVEQRQRMMANKDMERRLKSLEREEQKMHKTLDAVNKKLVLVSEQSGVPLPGQIVHRTHTGDVSSLQLGLKQIFEAMEKFSADSMKVYQELHIRCEEDRVSRENAKVP